MDKKCKSQKIANAAMIVLLSFFTAYLFLKSEIMKTGFVSVDTNVFYLIAQRMSIGELPYRDIFDHKGPLLYFIFLLGYKLTNDFRGIYLLEIINMIASVLIAYKTCKKILVKNGSEVSGYILSAASSIGLLLTYFRAAVEQGLPTEWSILPEMIAIDIFVDYICNKESVTKTKIIINGICFAAVLLMKPNIILLWVPFMAYIGLDCLGVFNKEKKKVVNILNDIAAVSIPFIFGVIITFVPVAVWLFTNGIFKDFIDCYFLFNSLYCSVPFETKIKAFNAFINIKEVRYIVFISFFGTMISFITRKTEKNECELSIVIFCATIIELVNICLSGRSYVHYEMLLSPIVPLILATTIKTVSRYFVDKKMSSLAFSILFILLLLFTTSDWAGKINRDEIGFAVSGIDIESIKYINETSNASDVLYVIGNQPANYTLCGKIPKSRYMFQVPIFEHEDVAEMILEDFDKCDPEYVLVLNSATGHYDLKGNSLFDIFVERLSSRYVIQYQSEKGIVLLKTELVNHKMEKFAESNGVEKIGKVSGLDDVTYFDPFVTKEDEAYKLYVSNRDNNSIDSYTSTDLLNWENKKELLKSENNNEIINRAMTIEINGQHFMYYTVQKDKGSKICLAIYDPQSQLYKKSKMDSVLAPTEEYEGNNVMNPCVIWNEKLQKYIMYYAAGEYVEPNVICAATSDNGLDWDKIGVVLEKREGVFQDKDRVGGPEVRKTNSGYIMYYIGYSNIERARICFATSEDGIVWERTEDNVLVVSNNDGFDKDACYKPTAIEYNGETWILYNGRNSSVEQIGAAVIKNT